jgi:hypothetical protein
VRTPGLDAWPVLSHRCRPDDLYRLLHYSHETMCVDEEGHRIRVDEDGLEEAADRIVAAVQAELAELERRQRDANPTSEELLGAAFELFWVGEFAIDALAFRRGKGYAAQRQVQHAGERPLAVCVGCPPRQPIPTILGTFPGNSVGWTGCFRVFEASTGPSGRIWPPRWCLECRPSNRRHRRTRDIVRAYQRRVAEITQMRHLPT